MVNIHIHGGNIQETRNKYNLQEKDIIDFSANINFQGLPPGLMQKLRDNLNKISRYPEPASSGLKKAIANYLGLSSDMVTVGNGAVELIYDLVRILKPDSTLIPVPAFSEYELAVRSNGGRVEYLKLERERGFQIEFKDIFSRLDNSEIDLIFICNPNNPTGVLSEKKDLIKLLSCTNKRGISLVVDEAFIDFLDNPDDYSVIDLTGEYDNLFVLRSLTKFYAIPGLRLGYGVGNERLIGKIEMNRDPWNVNLLAQLAGRMIFSECGHEFRRNSREANLVERKFLFKGLQSLTGFEPFPPTANYIFVDISKNRYSAGELSARMAEKGIMIRNCSSYQGLKEDYIRVAVKSREENKILIEYLREFD